MLYKSASHTFNNALFCCRFQWFVSLQPKRVHTLSELNLCLPVLITELRVGLVKFAGRQGWDS